VRELLQSLLELSDLGGDPHALDVVVEPARWRPTDRAVGDASRLRKATGWEPAVPFEATLRALLAGAREAVSAA
jgi:nucleoside-diphosphate-sugar epimerase